MCCTVSSRRGFTLIELLVVIAIIAILAAILFPVFAQARDKARQAACLSNTKQMALGIGMYRQDWDGAGPFAGWVPGPQWQFNVHSTTSHYEFEWQISIQPYLKNQGVLHCPSDRTPFNERPVSYVYNNQMSYNRQPVSEAAVERPAEAVILWDGYGPTGSATMQTPPPGSPTGPANLYREYSIWSNQARWLVDPARGLSRHNVGGHAVYMDLHAKWSRYGQGNTQADLVASVERAYPFPTAVRALQPTGPATWVW